MLRKTKNISKQKILKDAMNNSIHAMFAYHVLSHPTRLVSASLAKISSAIKTSI